MGKAKENVREAEKNTSKEEKEIDLSMYISVNEYAIMNDSTPAAVYDHVKRGNITESIRVGGKILIKKTAPYPARRMKSGKYVGWREKYSRKTRN